MELKKLVLDLIEVGKTINNNRVRQNYYNEQGMVAIDSMDKVLRNIKTEKLKDFLSEVNKRKSFYENELLNLAPSYVGSVMYNNLNSNIKSCNTILKRFDLVQKNLGR